ncbi:type VII secretion protein EccE [Mycolicibacterium septicum]|uniref:type VII secretion protein EccE n=1 Tax=Mycolicibacterium septicum TaxID=98668 RepID=UPI00236235C9|nr:type VII secretion protein EccE [Mycolicibacterium septicum]
MHLHSAHPVGLAIGNWLRLVSAFLASVAAMWIGTKLMRGPVSMAVSGTVAVLLVALLLFTWRGLPLSTLLSRRLRRRRYSSSDPPETVDHRLSWANDNRETIRMAGHELIAVVAVDGPSHSPSVLDHNRVQSAAMLPVGVVAAALRQFDVMLSGIDIVGAGRRRAPDGRHNHAATYSRMLGDHPAVGQRHTWCVLRLNTIDNVAALASRDSVAAAMAVCAQRLVTELNAHGCPARLISGRELDDLDEKLEAGQMDGARVGWGGVSTAGGTVGGYWVTPRDITTSTLDRLWVPDTEATVTTVQLRPAEDDGVDIGVLVRYRTGGAQKEPPITGLNPLTGRHDLAIRASLPDPQTRVLRVPHRRIISDEDLRTPIGSTGIVIGVTATRLPLLVPLDDARSERLATVTVAGEFALLVQVAVRSAAAGFDVVVVTDRPRRWHDVAGSSLQVLTALPGELGGGGGNAIVVVHDHSEIADTPDAAVLVRAVERGSASVADVHLEQDSNTTAVVRTNDFRYRVHIDVQAERNLIAAANRRVA